MQFYGTTPSHDLTYSDVFLVPGQSAVTSRLNVSLAPNDGTGATIPIVSANMNSVTGPRPGGPRPPGRGRGVGP
ncbi:MAG: IMP dehydrogenase, partial [Cryobacterium sp.]